MTPEEVRQIVREELRGFSVNDKYTFQKHIQMFDGRNMQLGRGVGTKIATATDQKLGFYGNTPVDQPATVTDPGAPSVGYVQAEAQQTVDRLAEVIDRLQELGLIA